LRIDQFDPVAEASELSNHSCRALSLRPLANRRAPLLITDSSVQNLPDQTTKATGAETPLYGASQGMAGCGRVATLDPTPETFQMIFGKRAFLRYCVRPSRETYLFANFTWRDEPTRQQLSAISPKH
jgi:hypothetical protein